MRCIARGRTTLSKAKTRTSPRRLPRPSAGKVRAAPQPQPGSEQGGVSDTCRDADGLAARGPAVAEQLGIDRAFVRFVRSTAAARAAARASRDGRRVPRRGKPRRSLLAIVLREGRSY